MKKLLFKIKDNTLVIKEKIKLSTNYKNLLNTNVISSDELIFSDEYLVTNNKIVASFINEIVTSYKIDSLLIEKNEFIIMILNIIKNNKSIINLILKEDSPLTYVR